MRSEDERRMKCQRTDQRDKPGRAREIWGEQTNLNKEVRTYGGMMERGGMEGGGRRELDQ